MATKRCCKALAILSAAVLIHAGAGASSGWPFITIRQTGAAAGTCLHDILHRALQQPCGRLFDDALGIAVAVVQQDIAVVILDRCIEDRFIVNASVGNCRIGPGYFKVLDTVCDTAEREGLIDVRKGAAVNSNAVHQCGNTKLLSEIIADPGAEFGEDFYSDDIHGLYNSLSES